MHFQYVSPIHRTRIQIYSNILQIKTDNRNKECIRKCPRDGLRLHKRKKPVKPV